MTAVGNSFTNLHKHTFALSIWALLMFWTPGEKGQDKRRSPWRTRILHRNTQGRGWGSGREFIFPTNKQALHRRRFWGHRMWWACAQGGSPAGEKGTLSLRGQGVAPCDLSLLSEVLLGKYNYPGFRVSSPVFPEKNQDSGGGIGPVCGGWQVSSKKMVERKGDVCNGPELVAP